jgi:hypothetical protein
MPFEVRPPVSAEELAALRLALEQADVRFEERPAVYESAWRRVALREAAEDDPDSSPNQGQEL